VKDKVDVDIHQKGSKTKIRLVQSLRKRTMTKEENQQEEVGRVVWAGRCGV